jgi:hypothetical protein
MDKDYLKWLKQSHSRIHPANCTVFKLEGLEPINFIVEGQDAPEGIPTLT